MPLLPASHFSPCPVRTHTGPQIHVKPLQRKSVTGSKPPPEGSERYEPLDRGTPFVAYPRVVLTAAEIRVARLVASLSRRVGTGVGMTVPCNILSNLESRATARH